MYCIKDDGTGVSLKLIIYNDDNNNLLDIVTYVRSVNLMYKIILLLGFWRQEYNNIMVFALIRNERRFHRRESRVSRVFSCSHLRVKKSRGADARKKRQQQTRWVGRRQKTILLCECIEVYS